VIVTESETCHMYKAVLLTIKVAARDASSPHTQNTHNVRQDRESNPQYITAKLDVELLLLERA
jgi:hypothetical protein